MLSTEIQVSLNGALLAEAHPDLDLSLGALLEDAVACARHGVRDFHVHPRAEDGQETLTAEVVAHWLRKLRLRLPDGTLSVSTGAWIGPIEQRLHAIHRWTEQPDFASVNFHEDGAESIADALIDSGVGVEAGVWHPTGAERFLRYGKRAQCRRLLIEMPDAQMPEVMATLTDVLDLLRDIMPRHDAILHGEGQSAWPMLMFARANGMATRTGLEDTLRLPDGRLATTNAELLSSALDQFPAARRHLP